MHSGEKKATFSLHITNIIKFMSREKKKFARKMTLEQNSDGVSRCGKSVKNKSSIFFLKKVE